MTNFTTFAEAYFAAPIGAGHTRHSADALAQAVASLAQKLHLAARQSPYAVLGVSPKADHETVRSAYMAKVQALHPDRFRTIGATEETLAMLSDHLAAVNAAYRAIVARHKKSALLPRRLFGAKTQRSAGLAA